MKSCLLLARLACGGLLLLTLPACSKSEGPPPALSLQELPSALQAAFPKAKPEFQGPLEVTLAALQTNGYPEAFEGLRALSTAPGLTKKQNQVTAAGLLTINNALQEAQSRGDAQAAQALQFYHKSK